MTALLDSLSAISTFVIAVLGALHVAFFVLLWMWHRHDLRRIAAALDDFTRGLQHRSVLDRSSHLSDQIDAFLADVNEVFDASARSADRQLLLSRISILDEKRRYLQSIGFEISYNVCRSMIEAYPLLGILGTILAIGSALQAGTDASVSIIVQRFGEAIWSTCAGLVAAVTLMFINSIVETPFQRLSENRLNVRQMVARVKSALIAPGPGAYGAGANAAEVPQ